MENFNILALRSEKRKVNAADMQQILTNHGDIISTRLGLHDTHQDDDSDGLILLHLAGDEHAVSTLVSQLHAIEGVTVKGLQI